MKEQPMTHPILSPNDEFADFELYAYTFSLKKPRPFRNPKNSYAREVEKPIFLSHWLRLFMLGFCQMQMVGNEYYRLEKSLGFSNS